MSDRRVHAVSDRGVEVVRYERAGKWYVEVPGVGRRRVTLEEAVQKATLPWFVWHPNLPGGTLFDSRVKKRLAERERSNRG